MEMAISNNTEVQNDVRKENRGDVRNAFSSSTQPPRTEQPLLNWVNTTQSELLAVRTIMPSGESKQHVGMSQIRKGTVTIEIVLGKARFRGLLSGKGPVKD
jgi:hypothetical protein